MKHSKYIIFVVEGIETPVLFNPIIRHKDMIIAHWKPVSAGFCYRKDDGNFHVWGRSESFGIPARPADNDILNNFIEYDC